MQPTRDAPPSVDDAPAATPAAATDAAAGVDPLGARLVHILKIALWLGVGLLVAGSALSLISDGQLPVDPPPLGRLPSEVQSLEPAGLLMLGLLVLLAGPASGLVYLLLAFIGRRDRLYALVVTLLLLILAGSVALALLTRGG